MPKFNRREFKNALGKTKILTKITQLLTPSPQCKQFDQTQATIERNQPKNNSIKKKAATSEKDTQPLSEEQQHKSTNLIGLTEEENERLKKLIR
ncbi:hypothetical protein [Aliikangiella sp. G2MR2-5]|uniref:hypothetical protein n=1 Tax=Aliikangiella sp. G2MR2-5 TaxID=2788943 RepID=UPI0018AADC83|nr:hypothetical protein [Aliikangiella sp. G2MR2-5]